MEMISTWPSKEEMGRRKLFRVSKRKTASSSENFSKAMGHPRWGDLCTAFCYCYHRPLLI